MTGLLNRWFGSRKPQVATSKTVTKFQPKLDSLEDRTTPALVNAVSYATSHYPVGGDTYVGVSQFGCEWIKDCGDFGLDAYGIDVRVGMGGPQGPSVHFVQNGPDGISTGGVAFAGGPWTGLAIFIAPSEEPNNNPAYDINSKGLQAIPPYVVAGAPLAGNLPPNSPPPEF